MPRVNRRTLFTPKTERGTRASRPAKIFLCSPIGTTKFHSQQPQTLWMAMESHSCCPKPISHIMWLPMKERLIILCPSLSLSLDIWDTLTRTQNFKSPHNPLAPLLRNGDFTPGLTPPAFEWWSNKGLLQIADLCNNKGMLSKRTLIEKYQLPEHFRYIQIYHYMQTLSRKGDLTSMTPMENMCRQFDKLRGHISATVYTS